jgi:uncharacterized protein YozE (UPF0346 family)
VVTDRIERLRDRRRNLLEEMLELANRAAEERRAFTPEEQGEFDVLSEHIEKIGDRIEILKERQV